MQLVRRERAGAVLSKVSEGRAGLLATPQMHLVQTAEEIAQKRLASRRQLHGRVCAQPKPVCQWRAARERRAGLSSR